MKANNKMMKWLMLLLCIVMSAGALTQAAGAAEATGRCTNAVNEGIEYFTPAGELAEDANRWRGELNVKAVLNNDHDTTSGTVVAMEVEVINSSRRYQCTEISISSDGSKFSCNSMPNNSVISGVYFLYKPTVTENTDIGFVVSEAFATNPKQLLYAGAKVTMPPYPCSRNIFTSDFVAPSGNTLVFYTDEDCDGNAIDSQTVYFLEQDEPYAIVNIIPGDQFVGDVNDFNGNTYTGTSRVMVDVLPDANFDYDMELYFVSFDGTDYTVTYHYEWDPATKTPSGSIDGSALDGLKQDDLPLKLVGGSIGSLIAKETDGWGNLVFPTDIDLLVRFWYENNQGTLGYENSIFHFERNLNLQFSPTCTQTATVNALYDPCQATRQMFTAKLPEPMIIGSSDYLCIGDDCGTGKIANTTNDAAVSVQNVYFLTRKCVNSTCDWVTSTSAYPYSVAIADGGGSERNYGNSGVASDVGTRTTFKIRLYGTSDHPFAITGVRLVADEPGTYVIYPFAKYSERAASEPQHYLFHDSGTDTSGRIFVTINDKDQLDTCQTLANNGYFKAVWNDCLSPSETQLLTFEHIPGKEEAWMENRSNTGVYFPYVQEWSYIPQKLQVASLKYYAEALSSAGSPGNAWCNPEGCYVPPYTKVFITGGTMYLEGYPKYDEYRVAYAREDTYNISHLYFSVQVKECENKKIPNTGISLRSPLKVNEKVNTSVDPATSYVFTGNSLRIPAIGLGMETPIPIVHVYYEDGSDGMRWDLSTLGNYVGELEGGSYIPYGGNSVLTGHYFSAGVFKNLEHLNLEDEIIIYGNDGVKYIYKVIQKFIAQPEDVYEMFQQVGDRSLTLVTCENYNIVTDEYERRYIVRAVLDSQDIYEEGIW